MKDYHYETSALYRLDFITLSIGALNIKQDLTFSGNTTRISEISYDINVSNPASVDYKYSYIYDSLGNIIQESYYELDASGQTLKEKKYYEYDVLNQLTAEDVYFSAGGSYSKTYTYDSRGNRTGSSTYAYEYRPSNPAITESYVSNNGTVNVVPLYNVRYTSSTVKEIAFNGTIPTLSFTYRDKINPRMYYPCTTTLVSINVDPLRKGYYVAEYYATNGSTIDTWFNVRFKVGNLASAPGTPTETNSFVYDDEWLDQLNSYVIMGTNHVITYDAQGNPTHITNVKYNGTNYANGIFSWDGRQLKSIIFINGDYPQFKLEYTYNDQGYRTAKSYYNFNYNSPTCWDFVKTINYQLIGDKVVYETDGTYGLLFTYDYDGTLISFRYDSNVNDATAGVEYFYLRNQQGDITLITNSSGVVVMRYRYDAYGNMTATPTSGYPDLTTINPYTYRGYRYDSEIGLYYLNSRFYNPQIGRFINSDGLLGQTGDILSTNMYAYCENNPVMRLQSLGYGLFVSSLQGPWQNFFLNSARNAIGYVLNGPYLFFDYSNNHRNPNQGDPNSTGRVFYPDGSPKQEREYDDEGNPKVDHDHHSGEEVGYDHDHDWVIGKRQPARLPEKIEALLGVMGALFIIAGLVADDFSGVGAADDFLIPATAAVLVTCFLVLFEPGSKSGGEY